MEAVDAISTSRTVIIIAHRLSNVKRCNQIVLLGQGKIEAVGSYEELTESSAYFKRLSAS